MSTQLAANSGDYPDDPEIEQELLPDLNGVDLVMSLSPKTNQQLQQLQTLQHNSLHNINNHSTPFSVTDILSPIEEYRKLELNPPSPYRYDFRSVWWRNQWIFRIKYNVSKSQKIFNIFPDQTQADLVLIRQVH